MNTPVHSPESGRRAGASDRRKVDDRRTVPTGDGGVRHATWSEQRIQFITRYLLLVLGVLFFNLAADFKPTWMSVGQINVFFTVLALLITANFWHASRKLYCVARYRFAMWLDIIGVSICISNDPYAIPPSLIVLIIVVLGNGMRYGMPFFAEAVGGSFLGACVALVVRHIYSDLQIPPGMIFLTVFAAIVLV